MQCEVPDAGLYDNERQHDLLNPLIYSIKSYHDFVFKSGTQNHHVMQMKQNIRLYTEYFLLH